MDRCAWVKLNNPLYVRYHDEEWGVPLHDDRALYELLILESFQAGLSWECVLNKRESFRQAFDGFDIHKIAAYGDEKIESLMQNPAIIRNRRKIAAAIENSRVFLTIRRECGSFDAYLRRFTGGRIYYEEYTLRTTSPLSDRISEDLKRRGMRFVGSTVIYAYLQSIGTINAHGKECDKYHKK